MSEKAIGMTYLTHAQLGNHNAGSGSSQLSDLKMYENKPYISGQAYRHAVRDALDKVFDSPHECTPQDACGELENCVVCDLMGYMNPDLEEPTPDTRYSPLRVTPLLGQYETEVTADRIQQFSPNGSRKKDEDGGSDTDGGSDGDGDDEDKFENSIAYRELTDNTYRGAWMVDVDSVGRRETEGFSDGEVGHQYNRNFENVVSNRDERVRKLIQALRAASGLAGQARHMADFMPDAVVAIAGDVYTQRVTNALHLEDDRTLNIPTLEAVLSDLEYDDCKIVMAGTRNPEVMDNWDEFFAVAEEHDGVEVCDSVSACFGELESVFE